MTTLCASARTIGRSFTVSGRLTTLRTVSRCSTIRYLSTKPQPNIVSLPPNLKIDPRSTCSPFYRLHPIEKEEKEDEEVSEQEGEELDKAEEKEEKEEEEKEEEIWYDISQKEPHYRVAIPLPDRLTVSVYDFRNGDTEVGTLTLSEEIFGRDPIRVDILARVVQYQRNKKRGKRKAKTKTIAEVSGSGRKVRPQKGQGRARAGHSRPPHWRGGAKAHGPKGSIQDYTTKLNKKVRRLGLLHALSQKLKEGNLIIVNDMYLTSHKTKELASILSTWDVTGRHGTTGFMLDHSRGKKKVNEDDEEIISLNYVPIHLMVASRNLYKIKVTSQQMANVYDILKHEKLFLSVAAVKALEARLLR